jgi:hypothetical protein
MVMIDRRKWDESVIQCCCLADVIYASLLVESNYVDPDDPLDSL